MTHGSRDSVKHVVGPHDLMKRMARSAQDHHPFFSQMMISICFSLSLRDSANPFLRVMPRASSLFAEPVCCVLQAYPPPAVSMYLCVFYKLRMAFGLLGFKPRLVIMTTELLLEN